MGNSDPVGDSEDLTTDEELFEGAWSLPDPNEEAGPTEIFLTLPRVVLWSVPSSLGLERIWSVSGEVASWSPLGTSPEVRDSWLAAFIMASQVTRCFNSLGVPVDPRRDEVDLGLMGGCAVKTAGRGLDCSGWGCGWGEEDFLADLGGLPRPLLVGETIEIPEDVDTEAAAGMTEACTELESSLLPLKPFKWPMVVVLFPVVILLMEASRVVVVDTDADWDDAWLGGRGVGGGGWYMEKEEGSLDS